MPAKRRRHAWPLVAGAVAVALAAAAAGAAPAEAARKMIPSKNLTIQEAIDKASPGDTLWVLAGVHKGTITIRKPIVLVGDGGRDSTILDGGGAARVVDVEGVNGGAIIGIGIRGGKANSGGGIKCASDTSFAIEDCDFEGNWEGGAALWGCKEVMVRGSRFRNNKGSGLVIESSTAAVLECTFQDNTGYAGGAISLRGSRILFPVRDTTFERNRSEGSTGGALNATDSSEVTLANCTFRENTSAVAGGGIAAMSRSRMNLSRCRFERNRAATGGAVHSDLSMVNITACIFDSNRSTAAGAAVGVQSRYTANINPLYQGNTFYRNVVEGAGATIFCLDVSPEIRRNIFVVDTEQLAVSGLRSSPLYDCNLIHDPSGAAIGSLPSANTLVGDPRFCNPEKGDFYLKDLSPALLAPCGQIGALGKGDCSVFRLQPAK